MKRHVIVIGGGVAGMQCAAELATQDINVTLIEKDSDIGGKVRGWHKLFPTFTPADEVLSGLRHKMAITSNITIKTGCQATKITPHKVTLSSGEEFSCDAVVIATGYTLFDARIKEEYGYGIYDNVITSADLEEMFNKGDVRMKDGSTPRRIAILHCVGSRDEKVCQRHCSKVCCVTGVKQAIELKQLYPAADVFNFYMDIRMFGPGYEEMYREAQQRYNVHFIRGRISEVSPNIDNRLQIKAEDTLTGRPLKIGVDMLVLLIGMRSNDLNVSLQGDSGLRRQDSGFMQPKDSFLHNTESNVEGIFYAGAITAPKNVAEALNDGATAALSVTAWLNKQ
ncbi:MAG: CoB--CoM heterodisulfide reductase iron-sulfur subunit A family protein [Alistipes sp.]|nr:CoB--CoM heterodisulfide reductase iron-sulfur subunit A family protein [Alistipes sp.]MBR2629464.1 CoB--CoM heterodisulfide reductase iron-sulfur subunit A family protein [Alistipes sp.]